MKFTFLIPALLFSTAAPFSAFAECNPCVDVYSVLISKPFEEYSMPSTEIKFRVRLDGVSVLSIDMENSKISIKDDKDTDFEAKARQALVAAGEAGGWEPNLDDSLTMYVSPIETGFQGSIRAGATAHPKARELSITGHFKVAVSSEGDQSRHVKVPDVIVMDGNEIALEGGSLRILGFGTEYIDDEPVPVYSWESDLAVTAIRVVGYEAPGGATPAEGEFYGIEGRAVTLEVEFIDAETIEVPIEFTIGVGL